MTLLEQVQIRLQGEPKSDDIAQLQVLCDLASVRICLRVREPTLPALLEPIAADVVVKLFRRWNYEGVLAEYDDEFAAYREAKAEDAGEKVVRFL